MCEEYKTYIERLLFPLRYYVFIKTRHELARLSCFFYLMISGLIQSLWDYG